MNTNSKQSKYAEKKRSRGIVYSNEVCGAGGSYIAKDPNRGKKPAVAANNFMKMSLDFFTEQLAVATKAVITGKVNHDQRSIRQCFSDIINCVINNEGRSYTAILLDDDYRYRTDESNNITELLRAGLSIAIMDSQPFSDEDADKHGILYYVNMFTNFRDNNAMIRVSMIRNNMPVYSATIQNRYRSIEELLAVLPNVDETEEEDVVDSGEDVKENTAEEETV